MLGSAYKSGMSLQRACARRGYACAAVLARATAQRGGARGEPVCAYRDKIRWAAQESMAKMLLLMDAPWR